GALELRQRSLVIAAVVQNVGEIDARFGVVVVQLQRALERRDRALVVAAPMPNVTQARRRLGHLAGFACFGDHVLAEQRAADLQHEIDVVGVAELENVAEAPERLLARAELEQRFAEAGDRVLVVRVENERLVEALPGPSELIASQLCVAYPYVQLDRVRIERQSFAQNIERFVVLPFVVQLMRALVVLFRTQKRGRHGDSHLRRVSRRPMSVSLLYNSKSALFKMLTLQPSH